ncbi:MAG: vancomycin resistance protein [Candidatus Magasanikbacteria bacterium CG11_big_fil_rev_8_21_14_0_20_39_34]|uniref:Vancomycin resistance protein n=1 Tax=Candidatus Magasanikbacteria bacterium CG11_big_fil_rev_8_21_14_0_20_39_34 TaxID=1974653 RepID=A0A2H0N4Z5_9BACT|nr:MAG: vancomycin resistance protein [Candidatus Magasanikbacteria bacterium CG11_big_fil_rev_8_21_14_0_20_39_34]
MKEIEKKIREYICAYEGPKRMALSRRYPFLRGPIIFFRHFLRNIQNFFDQNIQYRREKSFFECVVARHQSVLRRKLGQSNPRLQEQKITNLKHAIDKLNGIVIEPNHIFSFWDIVGKPRYKDGYVDGMLLSNGEVVEGIGGGLCQLSNFLYWIFLHTSTEIVERHHHSKDVFPDSGRVLPFGGGATILYNFIDLQVRNTSNYPLQVKIWLTEDHLEGQLYSPHQSMEKFHIGEKNHFFVKRGNHYFRYNEIYREKFKDGVLLKTENIVTNFAPVLYEVTEDYIQKNHFKVLDFSHVNCDK